MTSPSTRVQRREPLTPYPVGNGKLPGVGDAPQFQISVEFPSRIRLHALDRVRVLVAPLQPLAELVAAGRKAEFAPLPLRLEVPGATVSPPEQGIVPSPFGAVEAVFTVCALAEGQSSGARLEVFSQGTLNSIPVPLKFGVSSWPQRLLLAAFILPVLLFLPTLHPAFAESPGFSRVVRAWVPNVPKVAEPISNFVKSAYHFLAVSGAEVSLSFWALLLLLPLAAIAWVASRAQSHCVAGTTFTLEAPAPSGSITTLLTPLSHAELQEVHKADSRRLAVR